MSLSEERRMQHDLEAIGRQRQEWVEVVNAGDVERYGALLSREAVWIPPGQPALHGREAIRAWLRPLFKAYRYAFTVTDVQIRLAGDWAVERAHFTTEMIPKAGGAASRYGGSYLLLWRRDPGDTWHIERYVDVTEMQQAAAESPR